ncbi:hypothetical protein CEXT_553271 [Caerostris extrusa]|uniref:Uncharacterized protein n=1 Tax=Caerostris extrusa TaxID=172846 RepID=A0AAV4VL71_CAEEX|nr:hypothetical protein CEXT_553271 [Caerostris extrusa]
MAILGSWEFDDCLEGDSHTWILTKFMTIILILGMVILGSWEFDDYLDLRNLMTIWILDSHFGSWEFDDYLNLEDGHTWILGI